MELLTKFTINCFNLQKTLKKLINDGVELNKKFFNNNNFKDLSLSLVTLVENYHK